MERNDKWFKTERKKKNVICYKGYWEEFKDEVRPEPDLTKITKPKKKKVTK